MVEAFRNYLASKGTFTAEELAQLEAAATPQHLKRRELLLRKGEVSRTIAFVVQGCLRLYRTDEQGREHVLRFAVENWWINDAESFRTGLPAQGSVDALEDTCVLLWAHDDWERLKREIPAFHAADSYLAGRYFEAQINRVHAAISDSAEVRYEAFIKAYPIFYQRIPLHLIASYLGVSRETLSRIRKQSELR